MKMSKAIIYLVLLCAIALLAACSSGYRPAPVGDEIIWSSHDKRPEWTVKAPAVDQKDHYTFVGQSLYHSTERAARINAEAQAASQASLYLNREVRGSYFEQGQGTADESAIQNPAVTLEHNLEISTDQVLSHMNAKDWYLEQWRQGKTTFWRAFVLMDLPKNNL